MKKLLTLFGLKLLAVGTFMLGFALLDAFLQSALPPMAALCLLPLTCFSCYQLLRLSYQQTRKNRTARRYAAPAGLSAGRRAPARVEAGRGTPAGSGALYNAPAGLQAEFDRTPALQVQTNHKVPKPAAASRSYPYPAA